MRRYISKELYKKLDDMCSELLYREYLLDAYEDLSDEERIKEIQEIYEGFRALHMKCLCLGYSYDPKYHGLPNDLFKAIEDGEKRNEELLEEKKLLLK